MRADTHYSYVDVKAARLCLLLTSLWQRLWLWRRWTHPSRPHSIGCNPKVSDLIRNITILWQRNRSKPFVGVFSCSTPCWTDLPYRVSDQTDAPPVSLTSYLFYTRACWHLLNLLKRVSQSSSRCAPHDVYVCDDIIRRFHNWKSAEWNSHYAAPEQGRTMVLCQNSGLLKFYCCLWLLWIKSKPR